MDPQIQELIERMRELVDIIKSTSKIGLDKDDKVETGGDAAKAFTRGSDKIVNAMATLAVKLEGKAKTAAAEERAVGGLGIFLVRRVMDEVSYARDGSRNVLRLVIHRP